VMGIFINTLVMTDVVTTWTECIPLIRKSADDVILGLDTASELLPYKTLGLDVDNGSEFINYDMLEYCKVNKITFTRSRPYEKNDQAHVEERNGPRVRRIIG
ncbi:MAG: transposase family protein, partial [Gammaproteobacteria bacterium]|nr:transposase family protein [Gammaproteobacteria bacterium]